MTEAIRSFLRKNGGPSFETLWNEAWNLFKYGVVGGTSFLLNAGAYWVLTRLISPTGPKTMLYVAAVVIAAIYNFVMHARWTFSRDTLTVRMLARYIFAVMLGTALSGTLFFLGHEVLRIHDLLVVVATGAIVAVFSYLVHRWYTFHPRHG